MATLSEATFLELLQKLISGEMKTVTFSELEIFNKGPPPYVRAESYMCLTSGFRKIVVQITAKFKDICLFNKFIEWFTDQNWLDTIIQHNWISFFEENMKIRMDELSEEDKEFIVQNQLPTNEVLIIKGVSPYKSSGW